MDYKAIYDRFIQSRLNNPPSENEYFERHHIVPRCMGGSDDPENIIRLVPQEHFFAHLVLAKAHGDRMLWAAVWIMANCPRNKSHKSWGDLRRRYEWIRNKRPVGLTHPLADLRKHTFYHINGGVFKGTRIEFADRYDIPPASINTLFKGSLQCYEWSLRKITPKELKNITHRRAVANGRKLRGFIRDSAVYTFYNTKTSEIFSGTQSDMVARGLNKTTVSSLCIEKRVMSRCGWCLYKNKDNAEHMANRKKELNHNYKPNTYNFLHIDGREERGKTIWEMGQKYENGDSRSFGAIVNGKANGRKGWYLEGAKRPRVMNRRYVFINKAGEKITGTMQQISDKIGVTKMAINRVVNGKATKVRGWEVLDEQG